VLLAASCASCIENCEQLLSTKQVNLITLKNELLNFPDRYSDISANLLALCHHSSNTKQSLLNLLIMSRCATKCSRFTRIFSGKKWYCSNDSAVYNQLLLNVSWHAHILQACFRF